jgi:hypothetical protein
MTSVSFVKFTNPEESANLYAYINQSQLRCQKHLFMITCIVNSSETDLVRICRSHVRATDRHDSCHNFQVRMTHYTCKHFKFGRGSAYADTL